MTPDSRFSSDPKVDRALRYSVREGVAFSVMAGGGESYFSAFAMHFRATATDVAILSTFPPLVGSFFQLLSVSLGRVIKNRRNVILLGALLQVLSWLPLTLLPPLFPDFALVIILASLTLFYGAGNLITPQWTSLMGDLVPERKRGRYFSHRNRLSSVTGLMALVGAGLILQHFSESTAVIVGFVIIFAIAAVARMVSAYNLSRMYEPPLEEVGGHSFGEWWQRWRGTSALQFSLFFAFMQLAVAVAGPFFTVYMLHDLGFSYLELMSNTAVSVAVQFLTLRMWGRIGDAFGQRLTLLVTGMVVPIIPALWLLSGNFWYLLGAQALSGLVWGGFNLSAGTILFNLVPREERIPYLASHHVLAGVGTFLGSFMGGWLAMELPHLLANVQIKSVFLGLFLLSALMRLAVAATFLPRMQEETIPSRVFCWNSLIFRVTGARRWLRRARMACRRGSYDSSMLTERT